MTVSDPVGRQRFATTRWSVVAAAAGAPSEQSREALATLCQTYWYPLYAYARRRGQETDAAEDLVQSFFVHLLEKHALRKADPERGRFRSFLLGSFKHFLSNERDRARALKRGGGAPPISIDFRGADGRYALEPSSDETPEMIFERRWRETLIDRAQRRLRSSLVRAGRGQLLHHLGDYLSGTDVDVPYRDVAAALGTTEGAVKVAVHRLRRRFGALLREEIAQTVATPQEIDEELRFLFEAGHQRSPG